MRQIRTLSISGCSPRRKGKKPKTYAEVVAKFLAEDAGRGKDDLDWYARQDDFETLLEKAVLCRWWSVSRNKEQRHPHQRRLPIAALKKAHARLKLCNLQSPKSFDRLHTQIEEAIGDIPQIGPLTIYDIANRIGAYHNIEPKCVYLHRGTRIGARNIGLGVGKKTISIEVSDLVDVDAAFGQLTADEIENCLCIHKDVLGEIYRREQKAKRKAPKD